MSYISSKNKSFTRVSKINIGDKVCYKNGNGNWYEGVVESEEGEHQCLLAPIKKKGVIVNYGDINLIQSIKDLFTYELKFKTINKELDKPVVFSHNYLEWVKQANLNPLTNNQHKFAEWLLLEENVKKISQIGDLDTIFTSIRRWVKNVR